MAVSSAIDAVMKRVVGRDAQVENTVRLVNQLIQPLTYQQRLQDVPLPLAGVSSPSSARPALSPSLSSPSSSSDEIDNDNEYSLVCSMTVGAAYEQLTTLERYYGRDAFHPSLWSIPQLVLPDGSTASPRDLTHDEQAARATETKRGPAGSPGGHSLRQTTGATVTPPWLSPPLSIPPSVLPLTSAITPAFASSSSPRASANIMIPLSIASPLSDRGSFATAKAVRAHRAALRAVDWYGSRELSDLFDKHMYKFPHVIVNANTDSSTNTKGRNGNRATKMDTGEFKRRPFADDNDDDRMDEQPDGDDDDDEKHEHVRLDASILIERPQPTDWEYAIRQCTNHRSRYATLDTIHRATSGYLPVDLLRIIMDYTMTYLHIGRYYERRRDWHGAFTAYQMSMYHEEHPYATFKVACCYIYSMATVKVNWKRAAAILRYGIYLGSDEAMYLLAVCHSASHGLIPNEHEAVSLIKCSRDPMAYYAAAYRIVDPKHQRDERLHRELRGSRALANVMAAVDYKHAYHRAFHRYTQCSRSMFSLALYYDFGLILASIQPRLSMKLYHLAAEQGHCKAQYHLGMSYRDGWPAATAGGPYNDIVSAEKGQYWFNVGYNQSGCVRAMLAIAVSKENYYHNILNGRGNGDMRTSREIIPKEDRDLIWNLTIGSYEGGLAMAARNIGGWYSECGSQATARTHGIIYDMDDAAPGEAYIEAHKWYTRSMELGGGTNPEAQQVTTQQLKWLERMLAQNYPQILNRIMNAQTERQSQPMTNDGTTTVPITTPPHNNNNYYSNQVDNGDGDNDVVYDYDHEDGEAVEVDIDQNDQYAGEANAIANNDEN